MSGIINQICSSDRNMFPQVKILEQPASWGTRYRYEFEMRSQSIIQGVSGPGHYPTIQVLNYTGALTIILCCVTYEPPFKPHPHQLLNGNFQHRNGVVYYRFSDYKGQPIYFKTLSIQRVARKFVKQALSDREQERIDPYKTGFQHKNNPDDIDLNCVRLCIQVVLEYTLDPIMLDPIVTNSIYDQIDAIGTANPRLDDANHVSMHNPEVILANRYLEPPSRPQQQQSFQQQSVVETMPDNDLQMPKVEIIEQPASKSLRFRYECEGRSAGSIPGVNSTPKNKTFPTIRIIGYKGRAMVVVSCVTKNPPYRPHPYNLIGKEDCKDGICTVRISSENMTVSFDKLGIQCVKKKDIEEALTVRQKNKVDPFGTGFDHKLQPTSIDLNAVRLCFHVFLEGRGKGKFIPLMPIVSEPIYDKKTKSDLVICKLSHCSASVAGGTDMILLCEKIVKEDIQVRFFEERGGHLYWEGFANFHSSNVHKQIAIAFQTPRYKVQKIDHPIQVFVQLRRPSDGMVSEPVMFMFLPLDQVVDDECSSLKRKRQKLNNSPRVQMLRHLQAQAEKQASLLNQQSQYNSNFIKSFPMDGHLPFEGSAVSTTRPAPMFQVGSSNAPSINGLGSRNPPRCTPSPIGYSLHNIPPPQGQHFMAPQLQPNVMTQEPIPPILVQDPLAIDKPPEWQNNFRLDNTNIISNDDNAFNTGNVMDNTAQSIGDFLLNFP